MDYGQDFACTCDPGYSGMTSRITIVTILFIRVEILQNNHQCMSSFKILAYYDNAEKPRYCDTVDFMSDYMECRTMEYDMSDHVRSEE